MTEDKKEVSTSRFELTQVPTDYGLAFKDNESGEVIDTNKLLEKIANDLEEIRTAIVK